MFDKISFKLLFRHLIIIWIASLVFGFLSGIVIAIFGGNVTPLTIGLTNIAVFFGLTFYFTITHKITWAHFILLFLLLGISSLPNVLFLDTTIRENIFGSVMLTGIGACTKLLAEYYLLQREKAPTVGVDKLKIFTAILVVGVIAGMSWTVFGIWMKSGYSNSLYEDMCKRNEGLGCTQLGFNYETGNGVEKNSERSYQFYKKACELGHARGCNNLGVSYRDGRGIEQNHAASFSSFQSACDGGHDGACYAVAVGYLEGIGTEKNYEIAKDAFNNQCENDYQNACNALGVMYIKGLGVPVDIEESYRLFSIACDKDVPAACRTLGALTNEVVIESAEPNASIKAFTKGCELGDKYSCDALKK
jgi:hypothetical protein